MPETVHSAPILIPGVEEPEEMRVEPLQVPVLTAPERMLRDAERQLGSNNSPAALLPALNRILAKYPDFADGYVRRLASLCGGNDRAAILSDVNRALKYASKLDSTWSVPSLLSMRAKMKYDKDNFAGVMEDLDKAVHADFSSARLFVNRTPALKASDEKETTCSWTGPDMDALVRRFPTDYRVYLLRGLYYSSFGGDSVKPAIGNFGKAAEMNPQSALPHYFSAQVLSSARLDTHSIQVIGYDSHTKVVAVPGVGNVSFPESISDEDIASVIRRRLQVGESLVPIHEILADINGKRYNVILEVPHWAARDEKEIKLRIDHWFKQQQELDELNKALALDPNLLPALRDRASGFYLHSFPPAYLELKQFEQAIADYDKILALDPKDAEIYNYRGVSKMQLGDTSGAIEDFSKAVDYEGHTAFDVPGHENRADAYMKTQQWDLAIQDLTTEISRYVGGQLLLMNVNQFRTLYPEYKGASDDAIARKLHQTFHGGMEYADFADQFLHVQNQQFPSTTIGDLYLKRSDAYLKAGKWPNAAADFRRATNGFPQDPDYESAIDRWREIGLAQTGQTYIDLKSFDDTHSDSIKLWIKQIRSDGASTPKPPPGFRLEEPYSVQRYELNCGSRQIRMISFAQDDASGKLTFSREIAKEANWESIIPDTLGEQLAEGACHSK